MDKKAPEGLNGLEYANLKEAQQTKLQEMERQFNTEFGTDYYFMVMMKA